MGVWTSQISQRQHQDKKRWLCLPVLLSVAQENWQGLPRRQEGAAAATGCPLSFLGIPRCSTWYCIRGRRHLGTVKWHWQKTTGYCCCCSLTSPHGPWLIGEGWQQQQQTLTTSKVGQAWLWGLVWTWACAQLAQSVEPPCPQFSPSSSNLCPFCRPQITHHQQPLLLEGVFINSQCTPLPTKLNAIW